MNEREYADWYVWAKRNVSATSEICHAAAQAAMEAAAKGEDPQAAARRAGQARQGAGWTSTASSDLKSYAEWFDWARTQLGGSSDDNHKAAAAALDSLRHGGDAAAAANAARLAGGQAPVAAPAPAAPIPPPPPTPSYAPPTPAPAPAPDSQPTYQPPSPYQPPTPYQPPATPAYPPPSPYQSPPPLQTPTPYQPPGAPSAPPPLGGGYAYPTPYQAAVQPTSVPIWATVVLIVGAVLYGLFGVLYLIVYATNSDPDIRLGSIVFMIAAALVTAPSVVGIVGILRNAVWGRIFATIAAVVMCLTLVGCIFGIPVLVGLYARRN